VLIIILLYKVKCLLSATGGDVLNGLDLFSGIGGMSIALQEWVRPIASCEIDPYCQGVLLSRIASGKLEKAPIWDDIKTLDGSRFSGRYVDIIFGGFPCQDISVAGRGKGLDGERSGLFFEIIRLAKEIKPSFIFLENVPAITSRGGLQVIREITECGYDCRWDIISAKSVGARHKRRRWFLLAYSNGGANRRGLRNIPIAHEKFEQPKEYREEKTSESPDGSSNVAHSRFICQRCIQEPGKEDRASFHDPRCSRFWEVEPNVDRVADGVFQRVDRIRALGNAVVPEQAKKAFKILMGMMKI
jgi:DNA (cytosine-5)-methyltransferase 1